MDKIRACLLKILPVKGDLDGNMQRLEHTLRQIPNSGIDVLITPECYLDGYVSTEEHIDRENIAEYGVEDRSEYLQRISEVAARLKSWFIFGCTYNTSVGSRNAALVFDRQGRIAGRYYKLHCQRTDKKYVAGDELPVYDADFGKFGVMICADRRWPETVRTLALQGARVIFCPTYGMHGEHNLRMMRIRSYESEIYICFAHPKQSLITNPRGDVEALLISNLDHHLVHDLDLGMVDQARKSAGAHLRDRRPDVYRLGTDF